MTIPDPTPTESRFLGCLLGGALGDALGYPVEFVRSAEQIANRFGVRAPENLAYAGEEAFISDDTQMTLFSAEALVRARALGSSSVTHFALGAYQRWFATQAMSPSGTGRGCGGQGLLLAEPRLHARRAPGATCLGALALSFTRRAIATVEDPPNGSKGCGAVMRAAPFGLAATTREQAFLHARDAAVLTHGHPSAFLSAAYLAALVYDIARGATLEQSMDHADGLLSTQPEHQELTAALVKAREIAKQRALSCEAIEKIGGGWVGEEALAIGIACALTATAGDVAQTLWRAVMHGGDSDSTGSIAGNLVGTMFGVEALPSQWLQQLELRTLVVRLAQDLYACSAQQRCPDSTDYPTASGALLASDSG